MQGTEFGDSIVLIALLMENLLREPASFRGVRDKQGRLQAGAIVQEEFANLYVSDFATAPWNILGNQPESIKGAGTSLMEELVRESINLGFEGRLKLYSIPRAVPFYEGVGFVETGDAPREMELTPEAAERFLVRQRQFRETNRQKR